MMWYQQQHLLAFQLHLGKNNNKKWGVGGSEAKRKREKTKYFPETTEYKGPYCICSTELIFWAYLQNVLFWQSLKHILIRQQHRRSDHTASSGLYSCLVLLDGTE